MEGVTGAVWVGMKSLEHAFKNNQRLEIKSRQQSTAQHISSLVQAPAVAQCHQAKNSVKQNTLPPSTAQQKTDSSSRAKPAWQATLAPSRGQPQEPEQLCLLGSAVAAQSKQNSLWVSDVSNCNRTMKNRLCQKLHCANHIDSSWPCDQNFSKLTFI